MKMMELKKEAVKVLVLLKEIIKIKGLNLKRSQGEINTRMSSKTHKKKRKTTLLGRPTL
jgi:hypothetical protein